MPAIVLYLAAALGLLFVWHRYVQPVSRVAAIVIFLLPFCFTGRALLTGRVYSPIDLPFMSEPLKDYIPEYGTGDVHNGGLSDLYMQMIPWQSAVRQSFAMGEWPLWNPYLLCGNILAANMQSTVYDPLHLLSFLLPHPQALTFNAAMTFFLAAFFTFFFARSRGLSELAAIIAAAAYMYCQILSYFVAWPLGRAWALLPFVLLAVRFVVRETSLRAAVLLTSAFVMLIVVGHPESLLHIVFLGAVYGLFELASHRSLKAVGMAVACGAIALLLTAIALLPFWAAARETVEYGVRHDIYAPAKLNIAPEAIAKRALQSVFPFWGGQPQRDDYNDQWEPTTLRAGSLVFAFALAALILAPRRRDTWFFFAVAVVCTLAGLNAWPVADLLHALPLFDITINERLAFGAIFAMAMLVGIAMDSWPKTRGRALAAAALLLVLLIALGIGSHHAALNQIAKGIDAPFVRALTLAELVPLLLAAIVLGARLAPRFALPLVLALILVQRAVSDGNIYPALPQRVFYPDIPILTYMQKDEGVFRMLGLHFAFLPDAAALYGLEDARGYEAMTNKRLLETYRIWSEHQGASFNRVSDKSKPFLSFLNVKYAIGSLDPVPDEQWKLVLQDRQSKLLENTRVLPRAFVPPRIRYEQNPDLTLLRLQNMTDFAETAVITVPHYPAHDIANGPGTLALKRDGMHAYDIDARMEGDGWVVLSDTHWPGWRAYVDGKRVETQFANHAFIGVFVPKGTHKLRIVYAPESFTRGRTISLITLVGVIAFLVIRRRRSAHRVEQPLPVGV